MKVSKNFKTYEALNYIHDSKLYSFFLNDVFKETPKGFKFGYIRTNWSRGYNQKVASVTVFYKNI